MTWELVKLNATWKLLCLNSARPMKKRLQGRRSIKNGADSPYFGGARLRLRAFENSYCLGCFTDPAIRVIQARILRFRLARRLLQDPHIPVASSMARIFPASVSMGDLNDCEIGYI